MTYSITVLILRIEFSITAAHYISYFLVKYKWYEESDREIGKVSWQDASQPKLIFYLTNGL